MYGLAPTILLHPEHETTAASAGGGMGIAEIAIVVLAAVGLIVGLYLLVGSVETGPSEEDVPEDEPPEEPAGSG